MYAPCAVLKFKQSESQQENAGDGCEIYIFGALHSRGPVTVH